MKICFNTIKETDLEQLRVWRNKPDVYRYMYTSPNLTLKDQQKWFDEKVTKDDNKYWIVSVDGEKIAYVSVYDIDKVNNRASWAYYIGSPSCNGKGIGSQIELNIIDYVFNNLKLNKLCCEVFSFNTQVIKLHEKFGFEVEGVFKSHIFKNDVFYDVVTMGLLLTDWENIESDLYINKAEFE